MKIVMIVVGCLIILYILYVVVYWIWWSRNINGLSYYGKSLSERRNLKRKIIRYGKFLNPFLTLFGIITRGNLLKKMPQYEEITIPPMIPKNKMAAAKNYRPEYGDIFIASIQRSGTTWTQQIVYEIVSRGNGDLSDQGHVCLNAVSPWIESAQGVSIENAPLVGEKKNRIIKTHLPALLCPYSSDAKYIYVARNPVNCSASCYDWWRELTGPLMCSMEEFLDLFCSDKFTFSSWPKHVDGYWDMAQNRSNVLFLHFEEMKRNLPDVIKKLAQFMDYDLTDEEFTKILEKTSYAYMSKNQELFEMSPPLPYFSDQPYFKSGSLKREMPFDDSQKERIINYCKAQLKDSSYPFERFYPDL